MTRQNKLFILSIGLFVAFFVAVAAGSNPSGSTSVSDAAERQAAEQHRQHFLDRLRAAEVSGVVVSAELRNNDKLLVTVVNEWHVAAYQNRLQAAQNLWKVWAEVHSPASLDTARISIVDLNGNEVGGSRAIAGSMIWVQE